MPLSTLVGTPTWSDVNAPNNNTLVIAVSATNPPPADEGPIRPAIQALTDRSEYLKPRADLAQGALAASAGHVQRPALRVPSGSQVLVGPLVAAVPDSTLSNGTRAVSTTGETSLTAADLEGAFAFAGDTWYYAYLRLTGGSPVFVLRADAPDAALRFRAAAAGDVYLGAVRTDGAGALIPCAAVNGAYTYEEEQGVLSNGTQTAWTAVALGARVPPTARRVLVRAAALNSSALLRTLSLRATGSGVTTGHTLPVPPAHLLDPTPSYVDGRANGLFPLRPGTDVKIDYKFSGASGTANIAVVGFEE